MGAIADHSVSAASIKPLLKDVPSIRVKLNEWETRRAGFGTSSYARRDIEQDQIADAIEHVCGRACLECGRIEINRHVSMTDLTTTLSATCSAPRQCPHDRIVMREVVGLDGTVTMTSERQRSVPELKADDTDWSTLIEGMAPRTFGKQDFEREYLNFPDLRGPTPVQSRDIPLTAAGDAW